MVSSAELLACSDDLVNQENNHFEIARRSKSVDVNGIEYTVGQAVQTYRNYDGEVMLDIRPSSLDVVSQNSHWFERNINKDSKYNSTTLWLAPGTIHKDDTSYKGSITLPQRFKESGYGNGGLIDPVIGEEVPFDSSIYDARWLQISNWMLEELRNPDELVYSLGWTAFNSKGMPKDHEVQLVEVADSHTFVSEDEIDNPVGVTRSFLLFDESDDDGQSYNVYTRSDTKPIVVRNDAFLEEGERYPTLDQEEDSKAGEKARTLLTVIPDLVELQTQKV